MKSLTPIFATALSLFLSPSLSHSQGSPPPVPAGAPATVAEAGAKGLYAFENGEGEVEISTLFEDATWGQIFAKLAGTNKITWTQTKPNASGITGVQAGFTPQGAPPEFTVTIFLFSGPDGVRFDRMKLANGDDSREKSGLAALETLARGYSEKPPSRTDSIGILNKNQARQLILGCLIYAADHDGAFPPDAATLLNDKIIEEKLQWRHPETDEMSDFLYHGAGISSDAPNTTVIFAAPVAIDGKRAIAQADGAVVDLPEADYQKAVTPKE